MEEFDFGAEEGIASLRYERITLLYALKILHAQTRCVRLHNFRARSSSFQIMNELWYAAVFQTSVIAVLLQSQGVKPYVLCFRFFESVQ
jgi:hypothetical protein